MGALSSRQNAAIEEADIGSGHAYKYPPRSGNYFGSHFIMGGERFDTPQPEAYLFGENADLNFLGNRPTAFPYPPPQANEPTKTLKSLVNIRKESVRFVRAPDAATKIHGDGTANKGNSFNIEFVFDSDAKCAITIYYFCSEEITSNGISYVARDLSLTSETFHFKKGVNQNFSQNSHIFNPSLYSEDDLSYNSEKDIYPIVIHCVVEEGAEECRQSHSTVCVVDHHTDGTYVLRALKQKIFVDGLSYLLQEIYGIENKTLNKPSLDDETDDNGSECVICMSDTRDTLILPCRHLCLCNSCADSLRYQANNCPICRAPFRALLQIRAVQKGITLSTTNNSSSQNPPDPNCEHVPAGYIPVSLIEALNGPPQCIGRTISGESGDGTETDNVLPKEILARTLEKDGKQSPKDNSGKRSSKTKANGAPTEFRMSVLLNKDDGSTVTTVTTDTNKQSPPSKTRRSSLYDKSKEKHHNRQQSRDSLQIINERNSVKLHSNILPNNQDQDDDSDAEKLSPLLSSSTNNNNKINNNNSNNGANKLGSDALHIDGVEESIDDTDTDELQSDVKKKRIRPALSADGDGSILAGAEDSDYYTPDDPHTTILSPLCPEKSAKGEDKFLPKDTTKMTAITATNTTAATPVNGSTTSPVANNLQQSIKDSVTSLPDSPISGNSASTRSSGDSYSSSSSTKQLLSSTNQTNSDTIKILDEKQSLQNAVSV